MKHPILICSIATLLLFSCTSNNNNTTENETTTDSTATPLMDEEEVTQTASFGSLFACSPEGQGGSEGCLSQGANCTTLEPGSYNGNCSEYFTFDNTSMTMTAGNDCRTVNTGTNNSCTFTLGDDGVTEIKFDFSISDACHDASGTDWLAFWIYSNPWVNTVEVDFIEGCNGPNAGGLNSNFAGVGTQIGIYTQSQENWSGTITATFSGTGDNITANVTNSVNGETATSTLTRSSGYFFVLDTAPTTANGCTVTISNLTMQGSVPSGQCTGLITTSTAVQN